MTSSLSFNSMRFVGVTGTNGKTTCAWWLAQLLQRLDKTVGLIGTLGRGVWRGEKISLQETGYTTPDVPMLRNILEEFVQQGVTYVVMEVSSHGLQQGRTREIIFSTALFTNLSRDHLDYHGDMSRYGAAKAKLFLQAGLKNAVVNLDDGFSLELIEKIKNNNTSIKILTYSVEDASADVYLQHAKISINGVSAVLHSPWGVEALEAPVIGVFNTSNLLGVVTALCAEGLSLKSMLVATQHLQAPAGRMQRVSSASDTVQVFVDYAHTPDALQNVLTTLKACAEGRLWCVFGCGGDRDMGKRPLMGEMVSRLADRCVVTSDNPRSEDPIAIIDQITQGMRPEKINMMVDRFAAIQFAIKNAKDGDVVVIAGKGHEKYQEIKGNKYPFDDVQVAAETLQKLSMRGCK